MERIDLLSVLALVLAFAPAMALAESGGTAGTGARTIQLTGNDDMKFNVTTIQATAGEQLRIVLASVGRMPKLVMAHNVVVLKKGTDAEAFINASAMARDNAFIAPGMQSQVIAATGLAGAGEKREVTFTVPKVRGQYEFVCSFPGHYAAGMKGKLIVK